MSCFVYRQYYIHIHTMTFINCHSTRLSCLFFYLLQYLVLSCFCFIPSMQIRRINFLPCHRFSTFFAPICIVYCSFIRLLAFSLSRILSLVRFFSLFRTHFFLQIKYRQILFEYLHHSSSTHNSMLGTKVRIVQLLSDW